jgi:hypothetical protein
LLGCDVPGMTWRDRPACTELERHCNAHSAFSLKVF